MNKNSFGSVKEYKMLDFLTEKIGEMDDKHKNYVSSVIHDFNIIVKKANDIQDSKFKIYTLDLIYKDFLERVDQFISNRYYKDIVTYLKNYFHAKINNSK